MKRLILVCALALGAIASTSALAWHHHSGVRFGVYVGPPLFGPWWWYPPAPLYYDPPVVYRSTPPVVVESTPYVYTPPPPPAQSPVIELGPVTRAPATAPPAATAPSNGVIELGPAPAQAAPRVQMPTNQAALGAQTGPLYVYPRQGQSNQQQSQDEAECNRWASSRMGGGLDAAQAVANFQRALTACLDAKGYSVR
jgi:hypothetical protein